VGHVSLRDFKYLLTQSKKRSTDNECSHINKPILNTTVSGMSSRILENQILASKQTKNWKHKLSN